MTGKEELLTAYDEAWSFQWESIESTLKSITEEEAQYQHPIYSAELPEEGCPRAGTVLWHLVHLAHCYIHYTDRINIRPNPPAETPPPEAHTLEKAVSNLKKYRGELRDCIASLPEEAFDDRLNNGRTVAELARMTVRHDAWHMSQVAVARRLYRMRDI